MTSAAAFPLPPGRALSAWRRELDSFHPGRLRLAHLPFHRVEALVRATRRRTVDPFRLALMRQLSQGTALERLLLDREVLFLWLRELSADGLVETAGGAWRLTELGRSVLDSGAYTASTEERRVFTFTEEDEPDRVAAFLPLQGPAIALAAPPGWRFDPAALEACVGRSEQWKTRHGFPTDVTAVVAPPGPEVRAADWRRVMLDRPAQILLVCIPSEDAPAAWLGFAVRAEDWALQTASPALTLPREEGQGEALPDLAVEPSPEAWGEAWRRWRQGRGLSDADAAACRVEPLTDRVRVVAPRGLVERLGGDRNEAWLLAGAGRIRVAAPMEIREE